MHRAHRHGPHAHPACVRRAQASRPQVGQIPEARAARPAASGRHRTSVGSSQSSSAWSSQVQSRHSSTSTVPRSSPVPSLIVTRTRWRFPEVARETAEGGDHPRRVPGRHDSRCAYLVGDAPATEVFHRALGQRLALRDAGQTDAFVDDRARNAAAPEIDRESDAHRSGTDNNDLRAFAPHHLPSHVRCTRQRDRASPLRGTGDKPRGCRVPGHESQIGAGTRGRAGQEPRSCGTAPGRTHGGCPWHSPRRRSPERATPRRGVPQRRARWHPTGARGETTGERLRRSAHANVCPRAIAVSSMPGRRPRRCRTPRRRWALPRCGW